jgi:hypothetical protein
MTRDRAKELLPIIEGFIAGKVIQYKNAQGEWEDCFYQTDIEFDRIDTSYRVKPSETDAAYCCGHCGCDS